MTSSHSLLVPLLKDADTSHVESKIPASAAWDILQLYENKQEIVPVPSALSKMPQDVLFLIMDYLEIVNAYALGSQTLQNYCSPSTFIKLSNNAYNIAMCEVSDHL